MSASDTPLPISIFEALDTAVTQIGGHTLTAWAKAIWPNSESNFQSRLSEQRAVAAFMRKGFTQERACQEKAGGRKWTLGFCLRALNGAKKLLGGKRVKQALIDASKKEKDPLIRVIIKILAHENPEAVKRIEDVVDMSLETEEATGGGDKQE